MKRFYFLLVLVLMTSVFAATPNPGHDASRIGAGVFPIGDYAFNGSLTVQNTSNSSLFYINASSGTVAIGTGSPNGGQLQVYTTNTTGSIRIGGGNGAGNSRVFIQSNGDNSYIDSYGNNAHQKLTIEASQLLLNANGGAVGINDTSPSYTLDVSGTIQAQGTLITPRICLNGDCQTSWPTASSNFSVGAGWSNSSTLVTLSNTNNNVSANTLFVDNTNGYVGIGTAAPGVKLDVHGSGPANIRVLTTSPAATDFRIIASDGSIGFMGTVSNHPVGLITNNAERVRITADGSVGIGTANPSTKLDVNGSAKVNNVTVDPSAPVVGGAFWSMQPYIEAEIIPYSGSSTITKFATFNTSAAPFSKVANSSNHVEFPADYIPVQPGETLYGEIWVMRESGAPGSAGNIYVGVARYDKNKKPIDGNLGLTYFVASGVNTTANGQWTRYSGTTTLPLTHASYDGSDGGAVRYVRPYIIVNYPSGTMPTYWGGAMVRSVHQQRDNGTVAFNGNVGIGTSSPTNAGLVVTKNIGNTYAQFGSTLPVYLVSDYANVGFNTYYNSGWKYGTNGYAAHMQLDNSDGSLDFFTAPSGAADNALSSDREKVTITNAGYLGVNTTAPEARVHIRHEGGNGAAGLADYGLVTVANSGQATLGAESQGDLYANLNLFSNISGTRRGWHLSKRVTAANHALEFYYYNGSQFFLRQTFDTSGSIYTGGNVSVGTTSSGDDDYIFMDANAESIRWEEANTWFEFSDKVRASDEFQGTQFVDNDNTGYYVNPASTTNLNALIAGGTNNGAVIFYRNTNPFTIGNTDAVLAVSDRSGNDWGIIVDKAGFDYGVRIDLANTASYAIAAYDGSSYTFRVTGAGAGIFAGSLSSTTLDTGQGANELYDMNQNVQTTDGVTFATVDTGQGANELYDMNQNVLTSSTPQFAGLFLYREGTGINANSAPNTYPYGTIMMHDVYSGVESNWPSSYGTLLTFMGRSGHEGLQIFQMPSYTADLRVRSTWYDQSSGWGSWRTVAFTDSPSFTGLVNLGGLLYVSSANANTLNSGYSNAADDSDIWINYRGYNDAQAYFRDFRVGNGKGTQIAMFDGSTAFVRIGDSSTVPSFKLDVEGDIRSQDRFIVGTYPNSQTNSGEAWLFRAADREDGTLTVQLGGNDATGTAFEIVDRAWTKVIAWVSGEADASSFIVEADGDVYFNGGNVGVLDSTPVSRLTIGNNVGDAIDAYSDFQILLYDTNTASSSYGIGIQSSTMFFNSDSDYKWYRDGSERMAITSGDVVVTVG